MYNEEKQDPIQEKKKAHLDSLNNSLKALREEAIKGRAASGIEAEWLEDEEYYEGIDDANRSERAIKPTSPDGRVQIATPSNTKKKTNRSTVFVNITRPYVNAASAKVADMLLPTDDTNYDLRPTPIPDLIKSSKDLSPALDEQGNPVMGVNEQGQPAQASNADVAKQKIAQAKESCEKAKDQINDWLVECGYTGQVRQVIEDSARIGTGILKGPYPESFRKRAVVKNLEKIGIVIKDIIAPKSRCVKAWNFYPDPSCGENIHNGKYVWEYDDFNSRQLEDLKRNPAYDEEAIDKVLKEGPKNVTTGQLKRNQDEKPNGKEQFGIWYFHGYLSKRDLISSGYKFNKAEASGSDGCCDICGHDECNCDKQYPAIAVMVNDVIIKATLSPLDSGSFPYDVMPWQRRSGHWAGIGVARQMRTEQDGINASTRQLMDNAGVSGAPILIIDRSKIVPADGKWTVGSHKVYYTADGVDTGDIRQAFTWIVAPSIQADLMNNIQMWMQRAEDATGLPMLLQGQQGKAPDTVGGMTMLQNNASSVLRRIARIFDDMITEPHIGRYYEWLLMWGDDDSMKGDFTIDARGSSALVERDQQAQILMQSILGASVNPVFGLDPELVMKEMLKSQKFDAEKLLLSDKKKDEMSKKGPPPMPQVEVAKIRAENTMQLEQFKAQQAADHAAAQAQLEMQRQQYEASEADKDRQLQQMLADVEAQLASQQLSSEERRDLEKQKVLLADVTMRLKVQERMADKSLAHQRDVTVAGHTADLWKHKNPQVAKPAVEPTGKAKPGDAFTA